MQNIAWSFNYVHGAAPFTISCRRLANGVLNCRHNFYPLDVIQVPDIRIALPSEGALANSATELFSEAGLRVNRSSSRTYTARIPSVNGVEALFQRASDITGLVDRGVADIGVVGLDQFQEVHDVLKNHELFSAVSYFRSTPESDVELLQLDIPDNLRE